MPVKKQLYLLAIVTIGLSLNACTTLGPDYEEPEVSWLDTWETDLYGRVVAPDGPKDLELHHWWKVFNDPILDELIETASERNPSIQIAGLKILESRAVLGIATGAKYPQVQQIGSNAGYVNTQQHGGQTGGRDQSLRAYQAEFNIGWEVDFWGRFQRSIESADAAFFSSISNYHDAQVLLNAQVVNLYFTFRTVKERIVIARKNADIQFSSLEITRRLYESGQQSELDLQQARTQYLATLASIPALEISLSKTQNALSAILGYQPGDLAILKGVPRGLPRLQPVTVADIPARILMRRPDVRRAAWLVAAQSALIGVAEADLYPGISLVGNLGWSGNDQPGAAETGSVALGSVFTWNIFDHGRIRNNVLVQDARLQQAIENYQNVVLKAAQELDSAAITIVKSDEQNSILVRSVEAAERSLELAMSRYQEGYASFQRVLDAQQAVARQTETELVNQGVQISAVISFYKALGVGWQDRSVNDLIPKTTREAMSSRSDWGDLLTSPLPSSPTFLVPEEKQ
jgi:NodT family efflux transporter outer membrane factor (OMF) lipoprotein